MTTQTPSAQPGHDIDAGVIEDARARQRRHRRIAATLIATAAVAGALISSLGGGGGSAAHPGAPVFGSGRGPGNAGLRRPIAGAPSTQRNANGVETHACPLAALNRYLPARSGCVTVTHAKIVGGNRPDLVIVYSVLSHRHPFWFSGPVPAQLRDDFVAEGAYLEVVLPDGASSTTQIKPTGTWAAAIDFIAHVNNSPGEEIFLQVQGTSSGANAVVYGMHNNKLVTAGPILGYGGDSAAKSGFSCIRSQPPRVIQRTYELTGPTIHGTWTETSTTYSWHGLKLLRTSHRTFQEHGEPTRQDTDAGTGCGPR